LDVLVIHIHVHKSAELLILVELVVESGELIYEAPQDLAYGSTIRFNVA